MSEELKPCPFCGSDAVIDNYNNTYCVACSNCWVEVGRFDNREYCIKAWNNRPIEDEKDKEIARLNKLMRQKCYDCLDLAAGYYRKKLIENELKTCGERKYFTEK